MRATLRMIGAGLAVLGGIGVVAALFVPWTWTGRSGDAPGWQTLAAIAALGPVASIGAALRSGRRRPEPDRTPWVTAGCALVAGAFATGALLSIPVDHGLAAGGPLAVLGCAVTVTGWLLRGLAGRVPLRGARVPAAVALVVVLAVAAGAVPAIGWYTDGRFVTSTTTAALPAVPDGPPAELGRQRWEAAAERFDLIVGPVMAGRYLVLREGMGVRALDAVTGRGLWSYQRADVARNHRFSGLTVADGGRMTVLAYTFVGGSLTVALDTATGRELWQSRTKRDGGVPRLLDGGDVILVDTTHLGGDLIALNPVDGTPAWTWETGRLDGCVVSRTSVTVAGQVVAVAADCRRAADPALVIALSAADGGERWRWRAEGRVSHPIHASRDRIWVSWITSSGGREAALLDAGTGTGTAGHPLTGEAVARIRLPLLTGGVVVYPGEPAFAVDAATGQVRWRLTEPARHTTVDAVSRDGVLYLLVAPAGDDDARSGMELLAVDVATGEVRGRQPYDPAGCDGRCRYDDARVLAGPGLLVVGSREPDGFRVRGVG